MWRKLFTVLAVLAVIATPLFIVGGGGEVDMVDPAIPISLERELNAMKNRISELERSNPLQAGAAHDGTETRVEIGEILHPYSNPVDAEDFGVIVRDDAGVPIFLVDSGGLTIPGNQANLFDNTEAAHTHTSTSWTDSDWYQFFIGITGEVVSVRQSITCGAGITAAEAKLVVTQTSGNNYESDAIALTCNGSSVLYTWHWNHGETLDPNDAWRLGVETRITTGAGTMSLWRPQWATLRSAVAVDTNVTGNN